jgi:signal transduction histidine kinase
VRRRLVLAIAGVAALAVVLFAVPLALVLQRTYRDEELLRLQRDTVAATREIDVGTGRGDPVELPPEPRALAVYNDRGRRIAGRGGPSSADDLVRQALRTEAPTDRVRGGRLVVAVPLVVGERVTGAVRAERDDSEATRSARGQLLLLVGAAAGVVALAVVAAIVLGRRLARPLERLADAARRLGEGDFAVRAPRARVRELDDVALALDAAAGRLDDLVNRERAFSTDASHQLRTPLAALRIELEAMELRGAESPELAAALAQVDRLQDTVDTLLAVARDTPRSGTLTALRGLLDDAESRWRGPLAAEGRPLQVRLDDPGLSAQVSASVLREIVDVLLDNALRHGAGAVRVRARSAGGSVAFDVADEGTGAALDSEELFARRHISDGGHGIGLALARSLAQAEGGRLVLSRPAPPVFTLFLPGPGSRSESRRGDSNP